MRGVCLWGGGQRQLSIDPRRLESIRHKSREAIISFAKEPIKSPGPFREAWVGDGPGWPGLGLPGTCMPRPGFAEPLPRAPVLCFFLSCH